MVGLTAISTDLGPQTLIASALGLATSAVVLAGSALGRVLTKKVEPQASVNGVALGLVLSCAVPSVVGTIAHHYNTASVPATQTTQAEKQKPLTQKEKAAILLLLAPQVL